MSDPDSESEYKAVPSVQDLNSWTVKQLKGWLESNGLKRSGSKAVLVKRVYRSLRDKEDSESELSDIEENEQNSLDISKLSDDWSSVSSESLPGIKNGDIENYYLMKKNPLSGKKAKFSRQLKKARKFCAERFLCNIQQHNVANESEICAIRANCKPTMRSVVKVGNNGQTSDTYSLNVCLSKSTGHVVSAYCNCKAGEAGLCAHVGGLLFSLVQMKNACTSQICRWNEPQPVPQKPAPKRVHEVKFCQDDDKIRLHPGVMQFSSCKDPEKFLADLLDGMDVINPGCVLYKTMKSSPADISSFLEIFQPEFQFSDSVDLTSPECLKCFQDFVCSVGLKFTCDHTKMLEEGTRGQAINTNWIEARKNLITASNFGSICKCTTNQPDKLVASLRGYNFVPAQVKSLQHGRKFEGQA